MGARWFGAIVGFAFAAPPAHAQPPSVPALVPEPTEIRRDRGAVELGPDWVIVAPTRDDRAAAATLVDEVSTRYGWTWRIADAPAGRTIELRSVPPADGAGACDRQGYRLIVDRSSIVIEAATAQGRFYGVQTLRQLVRGSRSRRLPRMTIVDRPALEWRGVSDDISRGQISTVADFQQILRDLAYYKINLYQPYIEDMYAFESMPSGSHPGALTRDELALLVAEGRKLHITVCPVFQALTHQERLLARMGGKLPPAPGTGPSWWQQILRSVTQRFAAWTGSRPDDAVATSFAAEDPATFAFVRGLVDEMAAVTGGPWLHLGGDEWVAPDQTVTSDQARAYGRHFRDLATGLAGHGIRTMIYGDVLLARPEAATDLPRSLAIVDWQYQPADAYPSIDRIRALGFRDVIVSPAVWNWRTFHPNYARGFANIASFTEAGKRSGALGSVVASWGDDGGESLRDNNWAGYAYAAACAWEEGTAARDPFLQRFVVTFYGLDSPPLARAEIRLGWQDLGTAAYAGRLIHRHPIVNVRPPAMRLHWEEMRASMIEAEGELKAATTVPQHRERVASLRHSARRFRFLAERELVLDRAARALTAAGSWSGVDVAERNAITAELARLGREADDLEREYSSLWLLHNRRCGLEFLESRLQRDASRLSGVLARARDRSLTIDRSFAELESRESTR